MKGLFKKVLVGTIAAAMLVSTQVSVMAHSEMDNMVFAGYDTTDWRNPNKIYNEIIDGKYTNKQVLVPVTPEWRITGFETVYPYAGYSTMYLEGTKMPITAYNSLFPQWETRRRDYMWEMKEPYIIWERQQTKVNNKNWQWDFGNADFGIPDSTVLTKTVREAYVVNTEYKNYGFGKYNNNGKLLTINELGMYTKFGVDAASKWESLVANELTVENLSKQDENGRYVVTDTEIAALIPVVTSKYVTAKFNATGNDGLATKNIAAEYLIHANDGWAWDYHNTFSTGTATVTWTEPSYELTEPYRQYQYLVVNGITLDGKNGKDCIFRYTGGLATPEVTWKFVFFQHPLDENGKEIENIFEVVEQKYVDGIACDVYRVHTDVFGKTFFKVNGSTIEYWVTDHSGHSYILKKFYNFTGSLENFKDINAYMSGSVNYPVIANN